MRNLLGGMEWPAEEPIREDLEAQHPSNSFFNRIDMSFEELFMLREHLPALALRARQAAETKALSYRGFLVGAAAYVFDSDNRRVGVLSGANLKADEDSPKWCAEMDVLQKAVDKGYKRVHTIAVTGPLQPDRLSGVQSPTLHPCPECREMFRHHPLVFPDTAILLVGENGQASEFYDMRELFRLHGQNYFDNRPDPMEEYARLAIELFSKQQPE